MRKPKLIQKHYDSDDKSISRVYEYPSGLKLVHYLLPGMTEIAINVGVRAGKYFESQLEVPQGTAHLLEHLISDNPNHKLKTKDALEIYVTGNKRRPWIRQNASTTNKNVWYYGYTPAKGFERLTNYLTWQMQDKSHRFSEFIERDKSIVVSEINRFTLEDKDAGLKAIRFLTDNQFPDQTDRIGGTADSVKSIETEHLKKYYENTYTSDRMVIGVQSGEVITPLQWQKLNKLAEVIDKPPKLPLTEPPEVHINNKYAHQHFADEKMSNTFISINYAFVDNRTTYDYIAGSQISFTFRLIDYLVYKVLREELGLIYSSDRIESIPVKGVQMRGLKLSFNSSDLPRILELLYDIFFNKIESFATSKRAQAWLNNSISNTIFKSQQQYNREAVDGIMSNLLSGFETFANNKASTKAFRGVKLENIATSAKYVVENMPPKIWLQSNTDGEEIINQLQQSKLHAKWSQIAEQEAPSFSEFGQKFYSLN